MLQFLYFQCISCFLRGKSNPIFFVASRGHHADIGGITPGSMPPHSTSLSQEGASFKSFLLVEGGHFREKEVLAAFTAAGGRNLSDNFSDLRAQVAANQKGMCLTFVCKKYKAFQQHILFILLLEA